jgi:hypothetical protein
VSELIVFCNPQRVYAGEPEQDIARDYTKMAIEDYDKLVSFDKEYLHYVETPDYGSVVGKKNGRNLRLTLFAQQPMIKVGNIGESFTSSSYLFNPESTNGELLLPDLDIVQISGAFQVRRAANTIGDFYKKFGWRTYVFEGTVGDRMKINSATNRFNQPIEILNPDVLREIAKEKVGYSLADLCF